MTTIVGSVGRGGRNRRSDVVAVQTLVNQNIGRVTPLAPLSVDGVAGQATFSAIEEFQRRVLRMAKPDGLVEPNRATWRNLAGASSSNEWSGNSARWTQEKKLLSMEPVFRRKVKLVLATLRREGFQPKIFFGWRSVAVQKRLVAQGRSQVLFSFHNAQKPDGTPNAYAADIIDKRWGWGDQAEENGFWDALGEAANGVGLVWGGDWTSFRDVAHVQGRQNSELGATKRESGL